MKKEVHPDQRPSFLPRATILQSRYRIVKRLGSGGMGAVYEAVDRRLNVTVAVKETFSADQHLRRQFAREAHLLAKLNHPALPRVTDYFTESNRAFLVMQFIPGPDLAEIVSRKRGPFPRREVLAWADQVLGCTRLSSCAGTANHPSRHQAAQSEINVVRTDCFAGFWSG